MERTYVVVAIDRIMRTPVGAPVCVRVSPYIEPASIEADKEDLKSAIRHYVIYTGERYGRLRMFNIERKIYVERLDDDTPVPLSGER